MGRKLQAAYSSKRANFSAAARTTDYTRSKGRLCRGSRSAGRGEDLVVVRRERDRGARTKSIVTSLPVPVPAVPAVPAAPGASGARRPRRRSKNDVFDGCEGEPQSMRKQTTDERAQVMSISSQEEKEKPRRAMV
jgi:hypothetical protein